MQTSLPELFIRADEMLRKLRQSRLDNSRDALMTELCTVDRVPRAARFARRTGGAYS